MKILITGFLFTIGAILGILIITLLIRLFLKGLVKFCYYMEKRCLNKMTPEERLIYRAKQLTRNRYE